MKHIKALLPLGAAAALLLPAAAAPYVISTFKASPEMNIPMPLRADSSEVNNFKTSSLLSARTSLLDDEFQNWTTMTTDTAGQLRLVGNVDTPRLRSFNTHLRADRFAKGTLKISTPARASVSVNNEKLFSKENSDSVAGEASAALTLQPEKDYSIIVNILSMPDDKADAADFRLEFIPDSDFENVAISMPKPGQRRFEIEDINLGTRVVSTEISPDGKYLITRYSRMFDAKNTRTWATLSESSTAKILNSRLAYGAAWMPRGNRYYVCVKQDDAYDIVVTDAATNATSTFAHSVPENSFYISPDESYLIYYDEVEGTKDSGVMRRVQSPDDRIPGNRDRSYLVKYDIRSRVAAPITYGGATTVLCDISADSRSLLLMATKETPSEYPFYVSSIVKLDVNTLKADTLVSNDGYVNGAVFSPDARKLFVIGGPDAFSGIGINNGGHETPNNYDVQGYIFDIASRKAVAATRDFDPSIAGTPVWNRADNNIYFRAQEGFDTPLFSLNPSTLKISRLPVQLPTVGNFSMGENEATWLSYVGQGFDTVGEALLLNLKNQKTRIIDNPMKERLANLDLGKIEPWVYTHSDGTRVDGIICYPPDFDPAKKYPLIVYYYGGTTPSNATMHHPYTPHLFASRDYVVYVPNPSGTIGYGQEFSARHVNAWGRRTADEIIDGTKEFCRRHPFVDDKKIGCIGASYGGFMTQYLQTKTDMFACAVSHAGISNVTSYWGEGFWGYSYNSVAAAKHYPWTDPELFTKQGSLFNADKIHTPLLLLHGTDDTNVPIGESIQLFNALRVLGQDVEFITVEGQNHVITDYDKRKLWQATIMAWFAKYLQDDPRWWNSLYGK